MAPMPPMPPFEGHEGLLTAEPATQAFAARHAPSPLGTLTPKPLPKPPGTVGQAPRPGGILPSARKLTA